MSNEPKLLPAISINLDEEMLITDGLLRKIDRKPLGELDKGPTKSDRQKRFETMLHQFASASGSREIPFRFRLQNEKAWQLDRGCVGHAVSNKVLIRPDPNSHYVQLRQPVAKLDNEDQKHDQNAELEVERLKRWGEIASRPKQREFSATIRRNYGGKCAVTDCCTPAALEAAHVRVSEGADFNFADNGILLRSDIHALLDALLITFSPDGMALEVSSQVDDPSFAFLKTRKVNRPARGPALSSENIQHHRQRFREKAAKLHI
jgi:hypothetical protein